MNNIQLKGLLPLCYSDNIDTKNTTATLITGNLERKEKVFVFNAPWEGNHCVMKDFHLYLCILNYTITIQVLKK